MKALCVDDFHRLFIVVRQAAAAGTQGGPAPPNAAVFSSSGLLLKAIMPQFPKDDNK